MTDKQAVFDALQRLPESATLDEVTEELRIMAAIRRGREDVAAGRVKTQAQAEQLLEPRCTAWQLADALHDHPLLPEEVAAFRKDLRAWRSGDGIV